MSEAVSLSSSEMTAAMSSTADARGASARQDDGIFGAHRGPLNVEDDFAVLDDPVEQGDFTTFAERDGQATAESVLVVQGMYCAACADTVECALQGLPGVTSAQVHAATRRLTLRWDPSATRMSLLAQAVGQTGYRLLPLHQALSISERLKETRMALWRLFVAGICAMQVMMYALPAYVTRPGEIPADIDQLLRFASWLLSLPVVFFASGPFFRNAWKDLKRVRVGMDTPVSLGILVSFLTSSAATFDPSGPWGGEVWFDSMSMFVFFLLGGRYLELKARDRTAGALDELMNRLPEAAERQRDDGQFETVSARRLLVGDVVRVAAGMAFPGDGKLLSEAATVDEALLTGESDPLSRHRGDGVIAGSLNIEGPALVQLERLGKDTRFSQIVSLMEKASTEKPRLAVLADRIAGPFLVLVLLSALVAGVYWWQEDQSKALAVAVSVLIVTCPCALSLATPAAMLSAAGALAKRGVLVRRLQGFEVLAGADTVVFDKTGTLTHDQLALGEVRVRPGEDRDAMTLVAAAMGGHSRHPVSQAIARSAQDLAEPLPSLSGMREVAGQGLEGRLADGTRVRLGSAAFCDAPSDATDGMPDGPKAHLWLQHTGWVASFGLAECLRKGAVTAVKALESEGVKSLLLSGDRAAAAERIGRAVGIDAVLADASPEAKLQYLESLQSEGRQVVMVGDGLNDGPVLARADAAFAMGHAAALAQAQSDFVVQNGDIAEIANTHWLAKRTMRVVKQNLAWAGAYNAITVPLALAGMMPPWLAGLGMASSSLLVVVNAMRLSGGSPADARPAAAKAEATAP
ncbi:cation-translocating P-type ATPase [Hydrogenophaga sp. 5NK40-0174]|uniref:heavy metal translocating P-type ATPase n=1 Tax=Hydrogenophaga sp. 5NK40-0174 TaxID=3127649 RepID=UPI00310C6A8F